MGFRDMGMSWGDWTYTLWVEQNMSWEGDVDWQKYSDHLQKEADKKIYSLKEEIEKLKNQNEEYAMLIDHVGNLVEEEKNFFWLGDNVHSAYFENEPIFEAARQALKDIEDIK